MNDTAQDALVMARDALTKIESHEQVCGQRWKETRDELKANRKLLQGLLVSLVVVFVAALVKEFS